MSEDDPHERDVMLVKEKDEDDAEIEDAERAREAENPDSHRNEEPHSS